MKKYAIFLINLLQDINICRPLVFMTSLDLCLDTAFLVSNKFIKRDTSGSWQKELDQISITTGTPLHYYDNEYEALRFLQEKAGVLVASSESELSAHSPTHDVFRLAPKTFKKITLQHGFECVGFLQSNDHNQAHGEAITFGADIICGWLEDEKLNSLLPSQRAKLCVTGPTSLLQMSQPRQKDAHRNGGLICENLHSVRLNIAGNFKIDFMDIFNRFCDQLAEKNEKITLRPHPGGQYMVKNNITIPPNVIINNNPMYQIDLSRFSYVISAPSSVIIDMILARVPVAVWRDSSGLMDSNNYSGLTEVSTLQDWIDFSMQATANPEYFLDIQQKFLDNLKMPTDPKEIYYRFAQLFQATTASKIITDYSTIKKDRILFVANGFIPTLQLGFIKPLTQLVASNKINIYVLTDEMIKNKFGFTKNTESCERWVKHYFEQINPTLLVFCRYNGVFAFELAQFARANHIPILFHLDDDLLNVPKELGTAKYNSYNDPNRKAKIQFLLNEADLVYCSTKKLEERIKQYIPERSQLVTSGPIFCSGEIKRTASKNPTLKIGSFQ
jgi:hypothetical protein